MKVGLLGLGKMGLRIALKLLEDKHKIVVWNRSETPAIELQSQIQNTSYKKNLYVARTIKELIDNLKNQKIIWSMLPAGEATESVLTEVSKFVSGNDIVIDGGNSNWEDTQRWYETLQKKKVRFLGIGVSGGIIAVTDGYPLMVGGDKSAYEAVKPVLETLAKPHGGYEYFGTGGAGHYVKMVHNAIEYSYMQGIGEGFGVLEKAPYTFDLLKIAKLYTKNTLISGFMMDRTVDVLMEDLRLEKITGVIGKASKETIWTIAEAKKYDVPIENIEQALEFRNRSETDKTIQQSFAARMVSALRKAFGGHKITEK